MRGLPIELRERIVAAHVEQGLAILEVADLFGVSPTSVRRYVAAAAKGESLAPKSPPGLQPKLGKKELDWLRVDIEANPFSTSHEFAARYNRRFRSNQVHRSTILRAMRQLGFTHKKNTGSSPTRTCGCGAKTYRVRADAPSIERRGSDLYR